jgi:hypothetical protein
MVLAPENPLVESITAAANKAEVENYILDVEPIVDMINEDAYFDEEMEQKTKIYVMYDILNTFNVSVTSHNVMVVSNESAFTTVSDRIIRFNHNSDIKVSDMFKIESQINSMEGVNWTVFKEGFIEISWTPSNDEISLKFTSSAKPSSSGDGVPSLTTGVAPTALAILFNSNFDIILIAMILYFSKK